MAGVALTLLGERLALLPPGVLWVGYSGGLDSTVLLHMLASLPAARQRGLHALHVCHGLHSDAEGWVRHCEAFSAALDIPFQRADVTVSTTSEEGLEAAARRARHAAFAQYLPAPGVLALAHHQDDQAETLLLRLLHGAGHEGLAGMRDLRPLRGDDTLRWLWRPLLDMPRALLVDYARDHGLDFIEDPANAAPRFIRNRVRHAALPALNAVFPDAATRIAAAARRMREEADALDVIAFELLRRHHDDDARSLACEPLRTSPPALVRRLVGAWLDAAGLPRPPPGIWARLVPELVDARRDATPVLAWRGARLRRHRDRLYADDGVMNAPADWALTWHGISPLRLPNGMGTLAFEPPLPAPSQFHVRPRHGGEVLHVGGHRRVVKKLLQGAGLPPWQRDGLPLLFDTQERLLSVSARWNDDGFSRQLAQAGTRLILRRD